MLLNEFSTVQITHNGKAYAGMYIGEENNPDCKQCKQVLITKYPDPTSAYQEEIGHYKRNTKYHKAGDVKTKTKYREWVYIYSNILKAWEAVSSFPTVSYGLTNSEANVLIVDIDEEYESIEQVTESLGNVKPTYIIRNPKSKHIQFGFVLKDKVNFRLYGKRAQFNKAIKTLAQVFHSDACYNGPACKNPYYPGFDSKVYEDRIYSVESVLAMISTYYSSSTRNKSAVATSFEALKETDYSNYGSYSGYINVLSLSYLYNTNPNQGQNTNQSKDYSNTLECQSRSKARDLHKVYSKGYTEDNHVITYMKLLRNKIFAYFRSAKQKCTLDIAKQYEQEVIAEMTADGWVFNNMKQTVDATKKILEWCNTKGWARFGVRDGSIKGEATSSQWQARGRKRSQDVRHAEKLEKIARYREWMSIHAEEVDFSKNGKCKDKISKKKAAELIGITYDEFRAYRKMEERGEISYETFNSTTSNSEDELLQGRVAESYSSSDRVTREVKGEERGDSRVEEESKRRISCFAYPLQESA